MRGVAIRQKRSWVQRIGSNVLIGRCEMRHVGVNL